MGLKEYFAQRKEQKNDKAVERLGKKLMNEHHQTVERKRAIQLLEQIGSDEAIYKLLGRFTYHTPGTIVDEDEKQMVFDALRRAGESAVLPLERFVRTESAIYWPLRALSEISGEEHAVDVVLEALDSIEDRWEQSMNRMTQLASCLRDFNHPKVLERLIELSSDPAEEIRFLSIDGLTTFDDDPRAVDAIMERMIDPEETIRIRTFITDLLLERKWNVKKFKKQLTDKLPEGFFVDDTGTIQRK